MTRSLGPEIGDRTSLKTKFHCIPRAFLILVFIVAGAARGFAQTNVPPSSSSNSPAHATTAKERGLALAVEQSYASLDYAGAYRAGLQVLAINPRNITVRRLAAASALALKRYSDCLRLMVVIADKDTSSDDLHTLGECAQGMGSFSHPLKRTFEQGRQSTDRADAANYWLGVAAYRAGDYRAAQSYLNSVVVLPSRFESQKRFMLERIADIDSPPPSNTKSKTPEDGDNSGKPTRPARPSDRPADPPERTPGGRVDSSTMARIEGVPRRPATNGWFGTFEGTAAVGALAGTIDRVSLLSDDQKAYDNDVEAARKENRNPNTNTIASRNGPLVGLVAQLNIRTATGFRSGDYVGKRGTEYSLGLAFSGTYSPIESNFYAVRDTKMHPAASAALPSQGMGLRAAVSVDSRPNAAFHSRLEGYLDRLASGFDNQYGQLGSRGSVALEGQTVIFGIGGFWNLVMGPDMVIGGHWNGAELEIGLKDLGPFSLRAPPGHSLLSYQISSSIPRSRSKGVFQIMSLDGDFWEFNLAPTVTFSPELQVYAWYRFVSGSKRAYRSSVSKDIQIKQDDYEAKNADSQYESTLHDLSLNVDYAPWTWGGLQAGVVASYAGTRYKLEDIPSNPSSPNASPFSYAALLDRGRQNVTLVYAAIYSQF